MQVHHSPLGVVVTVAGDDLLTALGGVQPSQRQFVCWWCPVRAPPRTSILVPRNGQVGGEVYTHHLQGWMAMERTEQQPPRLALPPACPGCCGKRDTLRAPPLLLLCETSSCYCVHTDRWRLSTEEEGPQRGQQSMVDLHLPSVP